MFLHSHTEYIVWVLKDPDRRGPRSLTASAPEWAARICLKPQSSERQRRKCWVEGSHSRMPFRASRPLGLGLDFATISITAAVLGAALLETGRVRLSGSRGAARGAFRAGNKAVGAFLTSGSPASPTHPPRVQARVPVSPAHPGSPTGFSARCAPAPGRPCRAAYSQPRPRCPVWGSRANPRPAARNPSPGPRSSYPALRLRWGRLRPVLQPGVRRSGQTSGPNVRRLRAPPLSRAVPRSGSGSLEA